jgi:hypothetical protein
MAMKPKVDVSMIPLDVVASLGNLALDAMDSSPRNAACLLLMAFIQVTLMGRKREPDREEMAAIAADLIRSMQLVEIVPLSDEVH